MTQEDAKRTLLAGAFMMGLANLACVTGPVDLSAIRIRAEPIEGCGGGLQLRYFYSTLALFAEARVFRLFKNDEFRHTIAPVTVGVRVGF